MSKEPQRKQTLRSSSKNKKESEPREAEAAHDPNANIPVPQEAGQQPDETLQESYIPKPEEAVATAGDTERDDNEPGTEQPPNGGVLIPKEGRNQDPAMLKTIAPTDLEEVKEDYDEAYGSGVRLIEKRNDPEIQQENDQAEEIQIDTTVNQKAKNRAESESPSNSDDESEEEEDDDQEEHKDEQLDTKRSVGFSMADTFRAISGENKGSEQKKAEEEESTKGGKKPNTALRDAFAAKIKKKAIELLMCEQQPIMFTCIHCWERSTTLVRFTMSGLQWFLAFAFFCIGMWPLIPLPLIIKPLGTYTHYCGKCNRLLAVCY